ncbi:PREDICTED: putative oxidoreductase GLYR1 homolog [Nicrophorus vespilloides]|uniref:Cytokine-like nuclear factor N-PAC n=1 Tax=Nicrophorus vespilloides TaxID=110193 RepID=A0ABM1MVE7_NICVS|nr:PREDICTED: putative oxidoreductase GLYR1 homolog [Nicrophorus vespilloides]
MSEEFKLGDLVWAKMKGFCPWPGRIAKPQSYIKKPAKKMNIQCVYFYGTNNYAWIDDANIKPYEQYKEKLINSSKSTAFKEAVSDIERYMVMKEENPKYDPDTEEDMDGEFDKLMVEDEEEKITPKPKPKKSQGVKRPSSASKNMTPKKKRATTPEENGATPSYTTSSNRIKNYHEILNRPSVTDAVESPMVDLTNISDNMKKKKIEASTKTFGFLGLGIMGSGIVKNLIYSGHKVNIWNRTDKKAQDLKEKADEINVGLVQIYPTPSDIVANSDIIFCCVSDPTAVKQMMQGNCGILYEDGNLNGKGYVELTSVDSDSSKDISKLIKMYGGKYLEAQLVGSKKEADEGNLIVLVAGDEDLLKDCKSCFTAMGRTAFNLGNVGLASKMNMALQVIKGVALAGLAEGFALADRAGISPKDVLEVFELTSLCSPFLRAKADMIMSMDFRNVEQPLQHMQKDMRQALELADTLTQPLLMTSTANEIYKHVRRLGYDSHDVASVYMRARH